MGIHEEAVRMADDPPAYFDHSARVAHHLPRQEIEAMQFAALQARFAELRDRIPVLQAAADEQGIDEFADLQDGARLLFPHTVYKSYPLSLLERNRFDQMTKWLSRLTTVDLSAAEVSDCEGIDSWLEALERTTGLSLTHSSGTSGTMTFLPRSEHGYRIMSEVFGMTSRDFNGLEDSAEARKEAWPTFYLGFKGGRSHAGRAAGWALDNFAKTSDNLHTLYDVDMSSDVMFMAARVRRAETRGELAQLEISPALKARQAEFEETQRNAARALDRIFDKLLSLRGERVYIGGMNGALTQLAQKGLGMGHSNLFGERAVVQCGGGSKGGALPDHWEELCREFTGVKRMGQYYGMTEVSMMTSKCSEGRYHVPPWVITYVLDPESGRLLEREGVQTGRAGFYDLVPSTHWGGFATGDEITAHWEPCGCGRTTVHLDPTVQRLSEKRGGDDKITCAAADDAHAAAIDFLVGV
jgi:hypothetical protein